MYPEIVKYDFSLSLGLDRGKDAWCVKLVKGKHELTTHLEKKMLNHLNRSSAFTIPLQTSYKSSGGSLRNPPFEIESPLPVERCHGEAAELRRNIEEHGWDGA
jgi:hypothetical protein